MANAKAELGSVDPREVVGLTDVKFNVGKPGRVYLVGYLVVGGELAKGVGGGGR